MSRTVTDIPLKNVSNHELTVFVEPWGDQYALLPGETLRIVFHAPSAGSPEFLCGDRRISIYGWQSSEVFVLRNNTPIGLPTLLEVIQEELAQLQSVERERIGNALEAEEVEYLQAQLDSCPSWNSAGREVAMMVATRVASRLFPAVRNAAFVRSVCERLLQSRGLFLEPDEERWKLFFKVAADASSELFPILAQWSRQPLHDDVALRQQ